MPDGVGDFVHLAKTLNWHNNLSSQGKTSLKPLVICTFFKDNYRQLAKTMVDFDFLAANNLPHSPEELIVYFKHNHDGFHLHLAENGPLSMRNIITDVNPPAPQARCSFELSNVHTSRFLYHLAAEDPKTFGPVSSKIKQLASEGSFKFYNELT